MKALSWLIGTKAEPGPPALPGGYRLYAVGDVHGRDDLLDELLQMIETDNAVRPHAEVILVFLGDLIDRGPASAKVIERLRTYRRPGFRLVFLSGNHEEVLLRILDGEARLIGDWLRFGGAECLASYGADSGQVRRSPPREAVDLVRSAIPEQHVQFLRSFDDTFRAGGYLFVHAGIRPGLSLEEQAPADLRWIREPFLSDAADHGFMVVHGHTIREQIEERANRIGIDTGAYRHGVLSALALEGEARWFLQAGLSGADSADGTKTSARDVVSSQFG